jgi:hypothetical protein
LVIVFTAVYLAPAEATLGVADREEITATALDYAEGWYTGDEVRMTRALHPDLAKRRVEAGDNGHSTLSSMTAAELSGMAGEGYGTRTPEAERQADVEIYDVMGGVATVKVTMRDWVDYMHVAKYDGRWVIVNVLWDLKPAH